LSNPNSVMASTITLGDLPDEVLEYIIYHLSAEHTLLSVQQVSKRFSRLSREPLLWRYHCRTDFRYWDEKHRIRQKFKGDVGDVDWRKLYIYRKHIDFRTSKLLDSILSEQIKRIEKTEQIGNFGYDAKDTLLRHCQADVNADDVLARRYILCITHFVVYNPEIHESAILIMSQILQQCCSRPCS
jgi:F-box protein 21